MKKQNDETAQAQLVLKISREIQPMLAGLGPDVQSAVLADLFSLFLAGHVGPGAEELREEITQEWLATVRRLVPVSEQQILGRIEPKGQT